jgi:hypothetical protein
MKKTFYLLSLILISSTLTSMESGLTLAMYLQLIALVDKPQEQNIEIKEYFHQPKQQFKVKKTHQPHVASRRLFTQHHK